MWPPRRVEPQRRSDGEESDLSLVRAGTASWGWRALRQIEDHWLDPIALPLHDRMERSGWTPDGFTDFCDLCGGDVGEGEASELGCAICRVRRLPWDRFVRLGPYAPPLDTWIQEVKFQRGFRLGRDLGALLGQRVGTVLGAFDSQAPVCIIPVPTTRRRSFVRGIDHTAELARGLAREIGAPVVRALARSAFPSQRSVPLSGRAANVAGRFRLVRPDRVAGRVVILVDDVTTSGATLRASARALRGYEGSRRPGRGSGALLVIAAAVAVTPREGRRTRTPS